MLFPKFRIFTIAFVCSLSFLGGSLHAESAKLELHKGDHVCLIGNTLPERMQNFGHFETLLHARFPQHELVVRNLGFSADEVRFRPRSMNFGAPDDYLSALKADVILAFFGFNESFAGETGLGQFKTELTDFIQHTKGQKYNGRSAPRLVLISPIAHEDLDNPNLPSGETTNENLALYVKAMAAVADKHDVPFVDLFSPTGKSMGKSNAAWTFNGVHLTDHGYAQLAPILDEALFGPAMGRKQATTKLRAEVNEKNFFYFHRYRAVNGYYIYGGRSERPNGNPPFTDAYVLENERGKLDDMVAIRDQRIWKVARGESVPATIDDSKTRALMEVPTNFTQPIEILPPEEARKKLVIAEGYEVNCFASEVDFPDLQNPVQLTFDTKGRLWVSTMPDYPMFQPPNKPNDRILIFEDTDGDGKADKQIVFADGLHVPTGFELGDGGVYVAQQPNVMFLKDTDGDDVADVRKLVLHGFDSGDSHHSIGAFTWGPGGALYMHEGTFHHSAVETPYGPVRNAHGGVYRYHPMTEKLETFVHYNFANPWGHVFDRWGQNFVADASGGANYWGTAFSGKAPQFTGQEDFGPFKFAHQEKLEQFIVKRVRPTAGCEIVSSRHFPPEAQGNFLLNNCIGFQGILQHTVKDNGSGFVGTEIEPLLYSTDRNFRPTDLQFGPDGALYVVDWFNPLVGHMQHNLRDPNRDHTHGRVWRVTYKGRDLVTPPKIAGQPIPALLDLLKTYEDRTRYRVRLELREHPAKKVVAELEKWIANLDEKDDAYEHHLLEALWVLQHHHAVDEDLLDRVLRSPDYRARAAATRVVGYWRQQLPDAIDRLRARASDQHPRVRVEAVRACSFFESAQAAEVALDILKHDRDYYLDYVLRHTMRRLEPYWKPAVAAGRSFAEDNPAGIEYILASVSTDELVSMARSKPVYVALLSRHGVIQDHRREAVAGLAKANGTDVITELLSAITRLDKSDSDHAGHVLHDLAHMLTMQPASDFSKYRSNIEEMAAGSRQPITRQIAFVTLIASDKSVDAVWQRASREVNTLRDLVDAVPLIEDAKLRTAMHAKVEPLLHGLPDRLAKTIDANKGASGRFVRIELPGNKRTLTLAEVQVFSDGKNIARQGKAKQSSVASQGAARRAIDGNTSGVFNEKGQTHTKNQKNPWWELDLGAEHPVESIVVWNRSEDNGKFSNRLEGFTIQFLDRNRKPVFAKNKVTAPVESKKFELADDPAKKMRRAAINAVTYMPGHEVETFRTLSRFVANGNLRVPAIRGLARLPKNKMPRKEVRPLINNLISYIETVPVDERTTTGAMDALQLGNDLALLLPSKQAKALRSKLGELGVQVILIRPVPHKMQYDRKDIFVEGGKPVEIVFENIDIMPHNLIITQPGAMAEVGVLAERMATSADAFAKHFIPDSPKILHATRMLQTRQSQRLQLVAPTELGEYPFVCTFPGHWRTMFGTMHVVESLENIPLELLEPTTEPGAPIRKFVQQWTIKDLVGSLKQADAGRSFENGKKLFTAVQCVACHRINDKGGIIGPDLAGVRKKFEEDKMCRTSLLTEMLTPSTIIEKKYRTQLIETLDGVLISGVVIHEDDKVLRIVSNPLEKKESALEIAQEDVGDRLESKLSLMPVGLLNTLTKDDILDLLAFIESGGDPNYKSFKK